MAKEKLTCTFDARVYKVISDFSAYLNTRPCTLSGMYVTEQLDTIIGEDFDGYFALSAMARAPFCATRLQGRMHTIGVSVVPTIYDGYTEASVRLGGVRSHLLATAILLGLHQSMQDERFAIPQSKINLI